MRALRRPRAGWTPTSVGRAERRGARAARPTGSSAGWCAATPNARDEETDDERRRARARSRSRAEFHDGDPRRRSRRPRDAGAREICLVDADFADWPLNERAVVETLSRWAASHRKLRAVRAQLRRAAARRRRASSSGAGSGRTSCSAAPTRSSRRSRCRPCCWCRARSRCGCSTRSATAARVSGRAGRPGPSAGKPIDALLQRSVEAFPADDPGPLGNTLKAPIIVG